MLYGKIANCYNADVKSVQYHPRALKALARHSGDAERIVLKIHAYVENPGAQANNVKRLKGTLGLYRLRVGDYRVIFVLKGDAVYVTKIEPRGSAYE